MRKTKSLLAVLVLLALVVPGGGKPSVAQPQLSAPRQSLAWADEGNQASRLARGQAPLDGEVEVTRATMEQLAGQTVTVEYRDVYGDSVEASEMWLIWTP